MKINMLTPILAVTATADGRYALSGGQEPNLRVWCLDTGRCLREAEGHSNWIHSLTIGPDARFVASGSRDKSVALWELDWSLDPKTRVVSSRR